jgi:uncharacterized delta-60 repeat protein
MRPSNRVVLALALALALGGCGKVEQPGTFTLTIDRASVLVRQGASSTVTVTLARDESFTDPVTVLATGLPAGVMTQPLTIAEGESTGMLTIVADATATQGAGAVTVTGTGDAQQSSSAALRLLVGGPPGTLDTSFAGDGTFTPDLNGMPMSCRALVMTQQGAVVTGYVLTNPVQAMTVRFLEDGTLDPTYGSGGFVSTGVGQLAEGIAMAALPDGSVIVTGIAGGSGGECEYGVFKYTPAGALDASFAASGVAAINPGTGCAEYHNVAIATDGSIVAAGTLFGTPMVSHGHRFSAAGVQDPAFGIVEPSVLVEGSTLQPDGKLVLVGSRAADFWVARYNVDGTPDAGFGGGGFTMVDFPGTSDTAYGVVAQSDGKLLVVGIAGPNIASARFNANGSLDATFGLGGRATTTTAFETRSPTPLAASGAQLLFVGRTSADDRPAVARLNADGTVDASFGTAGIAAVDFGIPGMGANTGGFGVAVDGDGRILISAEVGAAGAVEMAIARLWP